RTDRATSRSAPACAVRRTSRAGLGPDGARTTSRASNSTVDLDVMIVRDPRESAQKCSLTPLRGVDGVRFVTHRGDQRVDVGRRILLSPGGEELTRADRGYGLLVIDCAWRKV